ncbi:MAG: hypothetical protein WC677_07285 [Clostridia bacterium]
MITFTLQDLGLFLLFLFGIAACVYIIILVRNLNKSANDVKEILSKNKENIDKALTDLPVISKNVAELSETAKVDLDAFQSKFKMMGDKSDEGGDFFGKIGGIIDIADVLIKLFASKSKTGSEKKEFKIIKEIKDLMDIQDKKYNKAKTEEKTTEEKNTENEKVKVRAEEAKSDVKSNDKKKKKKRKVQ